MIRKLSLWLAYSTLILTTPVTAQQTLNVRDADIRAFVQDAARVTGQTFIVDGRVSGKVSVVTDRPLSRSEYFEVFLSTLRANGLVAIPMRGGSAVRWRRNAANTRRQQSRVRQSICNRSIPLAID